MVNRKLFRPALTDMKEPSSFAPRQAQPAPQSAPPWKKPAPPDQTFAEKFLLREADAIADACRHRFDRRRSPAQHGRNVYCNRDCIKLTRFGSPNLLVYKHSIRYLYKEGDEAALGGTNGR